MTLKATPIQRIGDRSALLERLVADTDGPGIGVIGGSGTFAAQGSLEVVAGTGLNSSVAPGKCRIRGGSGSNDRGVYDFTSDIATNALHNSADPTNPRIDQVMARVRDVAEIGGITNAGDFYVQHGTPTPGATLDARTGVTAPDPSTLLLADVLVPAAAGSSASFTYRDRRAMASFGVVPPMKTAVIGVPMIACGVPLSWNIAVTGPASTMNNYQCEVLCYLPARVICSKIKWFYRAGSPNATANYNIGIYDSQGLKLGESTARSVPVSNTLISDTVTTFTLEAGLYRVVMGLSISAGDFMFYGAHTRASAQGAASVPSQNLMSHVTSGGTTLPANLNSGSWLDATANNDNRGVPWILLSE